MGCFAVNKHPVDTVHRSAISKTSAIIEGMLSQLLSQAPLSRQSKTSQSRTADGFPAVRSGRHRPICRADPSEDIYPRDSTEARPVASELASFPTSCIFPRVFSPISSLSDIAGLGDHHQQTPKAKRRHSTLDPEGSPRPSKRRLVLTGFGRARQEATLPWLLRSSPQPEDNSYVGVSMAPHGIRLSDQHRQPQSPPTCPEGRRQRDVSGNQLSHALARSSENGLVIWLARPLKATRSIAAMSSGLTARQVPCSNPTRRGGARQTFGVYTSHFASRDGAGPRVIRWKV